MRAAFKRAKRWSSTAVQSVARLWLPIAFAQLGLALGIQWLMPRLSASVALLLFFVYAASVGLTAGVILTIYTGYDYFGAGIHHLIKEDEG